MLSEQGFLPLLADAEAPEDLTKQFFRFHLARYFANGIQGNPQVNGRKFRTFAST